ncbi:MAG: glycosyltransferase family 2 protein [Paludibacteraceae bacterium]
MNKLLSIVIPVYKVEKYIDKCISSLIVPDEKQLQLLDIVVINDGTSDDSALLAKEWEKKYPDIIRVIDQENRGHGGAWNHGTELAVGKYLFYLDSDDWFDTDQFSQLITYLSHCDTDMVFLDKQKYTAATDTYEPDYTHRRLLKPDVIYNCNEYDWIGCGVGWKMTYAHNCVYRTAMLQQYLPIFCAHVMYDDVSLQVVPIAIAKDFIYTPLDVYRYYIGRPGQSFDPKVRAVRAADDVTKVLKFVLE